jgi:hypothetical protein
MNIDEIKTVLAAANVACSAQRIAQMLKIDAPSEILREIRELCFEAIERRELNCHTITATQQQFFSIA